MSESVGSGVSSGVRRTAWVIAASALVIVLGATALHMWIRYDPPMWWLFNTRGHWKRTVSDMRQLSIALEYYAKDNAGSIPVATGEAEQLRAMLEPTYSKKLPYFDAWGRSLIYRSDGSSYELRSCGRDAREDPPGEVVRRIDQDLILRYGTWDPGTRQFTAGAAAAGHLAPFVENDILLLMNSDEMSLQ